jgi:hypothetical protein
MVQGRLGHLPQLVAAACQVDGLGDVARQLDGFVVRRARLLTAAQLAQQFDAFSRLPYWENAFSISS